MISSSMWEELNKFYLMVRSAKLASGSISDSAYEFFKQVKLSSHLFEGITVATMSHGEAWHFARMGGSWSGPTKRRAFWTSSITCCFPPSPKSERRSIRSNGPR